MKKKLSPIQIVRAVIQLIAFVTVPALFITIFSSIGSIIMPIIGGSFVLTEYLGSIILILGVFLVTIVWGRYFCGFICSFGAMQDLLNAVGKLIPFKVKIPEKADKYLKLLKYVVLAFVAIGVWGFSVTGDVIWSPWTVFGIYSSLSAWSSLEYFLTLGGAFLLLIIIGSLFIERFFCKYLCPLGALFALVSRTRLNPIKRRSEKCGSCKLCTAKCSMSIPLYKYDEVSSGECINCLKCTEVCQNDNITAETLPAISGTLAVTAIAGLYYAGVLTNTQPIAESSDKNTNTVSENEETGIYTDGTYTGTGKGFRGNTKVTVTVEKGIISDITVDSCKDDDEFFSRAENSIISAVIRSQSTNVDAVSGATFSSNGLIEAIKNALGEEITEEVTTDEPTTEKASKSKKQKTTEAAETTAPAETETTNESEPAPAEEKVSDGKYTDGVYTGTGTGFRGETSVTVTVENGEITDITINSYNDDQQFFSRAESGIISAILQSQDTDVDAVSGATFSSNGIKEAVADALGIEFTNPNSSAEKGHGGRHHH
jgi:uncharacterized protein with FMN-binding domain